MRKLLLLISMLFLTGCASAVSAQTNVLWEELCPNTHNLITIDTLEGKLSRCEEIIAPTPTPVPVPSQLRIVDHTNVNQYNSLTSVQKTNAQGKKFMFMDRSVGQNMNEGLDCLSSPTWLSSPSSCRNYWNSNQTAIVYYVDYGAAPEIIKFPGGDNRSNIVYLLDPTNSWETLLNNFVNTVPTYYNQGYRIFAVDFNYLMVAADSRLDERFFDRSRVDSIAKLEQLERTYPNIILVYMTTSLSRVIGTSDSKSFNDQLRIYVTDNNKYLLDIADIESHDTNNNECLSGIYPIICRDYTVEISGGHLISGGKIKIAKGIWLLLSRVQ